jgi:hypothetical protein
VAVVNPQSLGIATVRRPAAPVLAGLAAEASSSAGITRVIPYQGKARGPLRTAWLYTPPQFRTDRTYPVMYLLHRGSIEAQWMLLGGAGHAFDRLIGQRAIRPVVVAMPIEQDLMAPLSVSTPPADGPGLDETDHDARPWRSSLASDLFADFMPFIQKQCRVAQEDDERAIVAISTHGTLSLTANVFQQSSVSRVPGMTLDHRDLRFFADVDRENSNCRASERCRIMCVRGEALGHRNRHDGVRPFRGSAAGGMQMHLADYVAPQLFAEPGGRRSR